MRSIWVGEGKIIERRAPSLLTRQREALGQKPWATSATAIVLMSAGLSLSTYFLILSDEALIPKVVSGITKGQELSDSGDETTLWLTIPKMTRVDDLPVYDAPANDEAALDVSATHVRGTDFPWTQGGANPYIAGHRTGLPGTKSYLLFYDLDELEKGDEIFLRDSRGTQYSYKVFNKDIVAPDARYLSAPAPDTNILTLVTCTLPDYEQRLIVQGKLTEKQSSPS